MKQKISPICNGYIRTYKDVEFYFNNPTIDMIDLEDIAHSLSLQCRYNGHIKKYYSVAEHSVWVSKIVDPKYAMFGLMHDAPEAYIGDMVAPLKIMMDKFIEIDDQILELVASKFNFEINPESKKAVKEADYIMFVTEIRDLRNFHTERHEYKPLKQKVKGLSPKKAKQLFLDRYHELQNSNNI